MLVSQVVYPLHPNTKVLKVKNIPTVNLAGAAGFGVLLFTQRQFHY
jgi:hypothetical protein